MNLSRVLIVFKKSTFQLQAIEHKEPRFCKLLEEGHVSVSKVKSAHKEHLETLELLEYELKKRNIEYQKVARADFNELENDFSLVISVGGDGTFLDTSHAIKKTPLLGVNSSLSSSFGHFCLANKTNLSKILSTIRSGKLKPEKLLRLQLHLNKKPLSELVLNEVLVAHSNPAGTSRYHIEINGTREEQRSSGIFIGSPAGSTGSIRSAGGRLLDITLPEYQFVVREPWIRPGERYKFKKGKLTRSDSLKIISQMRTGAIYIDGQHIEYPFFLGDELTISASPDDLIAFIDPRINNLFL